MIIRKRLRIVIMAMMLISFLTSCTSADKGEKTANMAETSMDHQSLGNKKVEDEVESAAKTVDNGLVIVKDELNQLSYAGQNYHVQTFHAQFTLHNDNDHAIEFLLRLPYEDKEIDEKESIFIFLDNSSNEVKFHLDANESKTFVIDSKDYTIVSNLGPNKIGSLGMVHQLVINTGDKWNYININNPRQITSWDIETNVEMMNKFNKYEKRIYALNQNNEKLQSKIEDLQSIIDLLKDGGANFKNDLPEYRILKYSEMSGIRKYIGQAPLRIYPSLEATVLSPYDGEKIVNCIYTVTLNSTSPEPEIWGMVLENSYDTTKIGFVPIENLVIPDEPEHKIIPTESLGGFKRGDRIEKLIGTLDRDYSVIHEMVCIYSFPDDNYESMDPREDIFSGNRSIDAFVNDYYQVTLIRTDSPQFQLECGFKVGDKASDVFRYFEEHYTASDDNYYGNYNYSLSENEIISFTINTSELVDESLIESIWIR